ncbi:MAG: hypothetical protein Q9O62_08050 [Ardenticatenia bacterium]|nr:hypothetical protein [Ardenticatenia bacterium]
MRRHGLAFAEGRDVLLDGADAEERLREIASLADDAPEKLATLPGDFGFVRFRDRGRATVVRSCGGLVPFYIGRIQQRLVVSTTLTAIVRHLPGDPPRLDPLVNAVWAASWPLFPGAHLFRRDRHRAPGPLRQD